MAVSVAALLAFQQAPAGVTGNLGPQYRGALAVRGSGDVANTAHALIMSGTAQILSVGPSTPEFLFDYVTSINRDFIQPSGLCIGGRDGCALVAVYTPEQLRPLTGIGDMEFDASVSAGLSNLDTCIRGGRCTATKSPYTSTNLQRLDDSSFVIAGVSQSAVISSYAKNDLINSPVDRTVSFILISNPNRPNGGILERLRGLYVPVLGISFNGATRTDSSRSDPLLTVDIARQYDAWNDFPTNPLNLLADLNAALGALFQHNRYTESDFPIPQLQGYFQDTTYYLAPNTLLPLLIPLSLVPVIGMPLAKALDPPLRVLVETGYDRTINPGQPTTARFFYFPNPVATLINFAVAIPTGWDDAISYISGDPGNRPFHTSPQPAYGVGGPPIYTGAVDPYQQVDDQAQVTARQGAAETPAGSRPQSRSQSRSLRPGANASVPPRDSSSPRVATGTSARHSPER